MSETGETARTMARALLDGVIVPSKLSSKRMVPVPSSPTNAPEVTGASKAKLTGAALAGSSAAASASAPIDRLIDSNFNGFTRVAQECARLTEPPDRGRGIQDAD